MTSKPQSDFFGELQARGLVKQTTSGDLMATLGETSLTLYIGFDPTSESLHVGSLLQIVTLLRFQRAGHTPIALVGGATGMIGDPSGKGSERSLLTPDILEKNVAGIERTLRRFLSFEGPHPARVVNNADWFRGFSYLEFLRDVGKHFTVNHMMAKESVRARLEDREHGISYTEFSYMLLQAYDFYHLHDQLGCRLQVGGSDQWGNITAGTELIRRLRAHTDESGHPLPLPPEQEVFGLTTPLVMKADGTKFGKTESGSVWLDAEKTSPYQFYQFWIQTQDADVGPFLRYFTFLPLPEIERLEATITSAPEKREAQTRLATEMTLFVHGQEGLARAQKVTQALFSESLQELDGSTIQELFSGAPQSSIEAGTLKEGGLPLIDLLVLSKLSPSKGAARKEILGGGISLNNVRISDANFCVTATHLIAGQYLVLRKGKKTYHLIQCIPTTRSP